MSGVEFLVLAIGILFIVVAIAVLKIHPFLALILAGFLVGIISPVPLELKEEVSSLQSELKARLERGDMSEEEFRAYSQTASDRAKERIAAKKGTSGSQAVQALELTAQEFGSTAASIGIVIALAAIIGQCLMESGAADKIVRRLLAFLGEKRAPTALLGSGYILAVPVFFDTVFFLLIPLARALRLRTGKNFVLFVLSIAIGSVITHSLVPPTPGPLVMVENFSELGLNLGNAIVLGFVLGIVPAALGLLFSKVINRRWDIPLREAMGSSMEELEEVIRRPEEKLPGFYLAVLPVVLPVLLITGHTALEALNSEGIVALPGWVLGWTAFFGNKNFALLAGAACAVLTLKHQRKLSLHHLRERLEPAILSAGVIILITSAGGAFGKMLSRCGISEALQDISGGGQFSGLTLILLAWGLSCIMKIAQGSGTVSMITASAMIASLVGTGTALPYHPIYLFAAIGFGSVVISWMNDSGFWVVCKMSGFTEKETLATWTTVLALIGVTGLIEVAVLSRLWPLV